MKRIASVLATATALTFVSIAPASAWGVEGHGIVGDVAAAKLSPTASAEVAKLLQGEPNPTLAGVASWADEYRSTPDGAATAPWHFVNIAENDCVYAPEINGSGGANVIETIRNQSAILADKAKPADQRRDALKFLVHFVGDIEQPMHTGYAKDRGGNSVKLTYNGRSTNLHAVWDSGLLDGGSAARVAALPAPQPGSTDPAQWAQESCRIAVGAYPSSSVIGADYTAKYRPVAEAQLRLAGERLGRLLTDTLG